MKKQKIDNKTLISEMKQMLHTPKLTLENMIFSDLNEDDLENYYDDGMPQGGEEGGNPKMGMEEPNIPNENDITGTINKIRQLALQSIAKLADDPTSKEYDIMKRIWNICDKSFETDKKNNNGGE